MGWGEDEIGLMKAVDPSILRWILYHSKCGKLSVALARLQEEVEPLTDSFQLTFPVDLYKVLDDIQAQYLTAALKVAHGNVSHAAELCHLKRSTFNAQRRRLGLTTQRGQANGHWDERHLQL